MKPYPPPNPVIPTVMWLVVVVVGSVFLAPVIVLVGIYDILTQRNRTPHSPTVCDPVDVAAENIPESILPESIKPDDSGDRLLEWILTEAERQAWVNEVEKGLQNK
jgi:hypothetical protein